ncbi:MAG: GatB/YqeY domain-containing protein [Bacteroidota bacterium]
MSLKDIINDELKSALKSGDKIRLETIRSLRALILEFEKSGVAKELTPDDELKLLTSAAKKRKESIEQFQNANRTELAEKEILELKVIEEFLPKQLSYNEIFAEVKKYADEIGAKVKEDFPKLMPMAAKNLKGKADGKIIKEIVEKILSGN